MEATMSMRWTEADLAAYTGKARGGKVRALTLSPERRQEIATNAATTRWAKRPKYLNVKTTDLKGVVHDAKGEYERWRDLELLEKAGEIRNLRRQVVYALVVNGQLITTYKADFAYEEGATTIVEDRKSPRTRKLESFRHKVKLMQSLHGIQIREV